MSKKIKLYYWALVASAIFPLVTDAQVGGSIQGILGNVRTTLLTIISLLFVIATLVFIWGVVQYVVRSDPEGKAEARHTMLYGIIGLAVMSAAWGLVQLLINYFGVGGVGIPAGPGTGGVYYNYPAP